MALLTNINGKFSVSDAGAVTFNNAFTFPTADGTANYVLKTNGSGQLAWGPDNDGGDITGSGTANTVTKFTGAKTIGDGPITFSSNDSTFAGRIDIDGSPVATGDTRAELSIDENNSASAGRGGGLTFGRQGNVYGGIKTLQNTSSNDNATMYFQTIGGGTVSNRMVIDELGNVGIGDTSPQGKLEVNNRNTATGAALFIKGGEDDLDPVAGQYTGLAFGYGGGDIYNNASILWEFTNTAANGKLHFAVNPTAGDGTADLSDSKMTILDSGNVGIGDTTPTSKLTILGTSTAASNTPSDAIVDIHGTSTAHLLMGVANVSPYGAWINTDATGQPLVLQGVGGNVGIGTTTPTTKLHLGGTAPGDSIIRQDSTASGTNWEIGERAAGKWQIFEDDGDTIVATFMSTGNVGIGTTSPRSTLEVDGQVLISNTFPALDFVDTNSFTDVNDRFRVRAGGNQGLMQWYDDSNSSLLTLMTLNPNGDVIVPNGNVGIGTTSPAQALQIVQGEQMMVGNYLIIGSGDSSYLGVMGFNRDVTNGNIYNSSYGAYQIHNYQGTLKLQVYSAAGGTIGEHKFYNDASIRFKSSVEFSDGYVRLINNQLQSGFNSNTEDNDFWINYTGYQGGATRYRDFRIGNGKQGQIAFFDGSTGYSIFNGNVGIGTTSPSAKLEVNGALFVGNHTATVTPTSGIFIEEASGVDTQIQMYTYGGSVFRIKGSEIKADIGWGSSQNRSVNFNNTGTGDISVGIGTTGPSYKLDVAGTIRATGDVIAYSDVRVKENIKTIDNSLEKVSKLRGVEFNKIGDNKKSIGVIAQEIEKVIPEVVKEDDKGMKSVAYGNISGLLIEAIKELKAEIEELKKYKCDCKR